MSDYFGKMFKLDIMMLNCITKMSYSWIQLMVNHKMSLRLAGHHRPDACMKKRKRGTKTIILICLNLNSHRLMGTKVLGSSVPEWFPLFAVPSHSHQRCSASADRWSTSWTKTAGTEQNKDDISSFLLGGGTGAVSYDKLQPLLCLKPSIPHNHHRNQTI